MNLGTHMPDGERRKPIDIEVCRSKVKVTLSIHMFATLLSHLWCITDFLLVQFLHYHITYFTILIPHIDHDVYVSARHV
jgi:hypothetical protein